MAIDFRGPMERCLLKIEKAVVDKINSGVPPPNAPSTIKAKKSSKTLIESGQMLKHVDHKISGEGANLTGEVGFFDEENAEKAIWNEYGTRDGHIPPRPFLRPAWDESSDEAIDQMAEEVFSQVERELGW